MIVYLEFNIISTKVSLYYAFYFLQMAIQTFFNFFVVTQQKKPSKKPSKKNLGCLLKLKNIVLFLIRQSKNI
ncbi:hypothetical protein MS2017_1401 [Bathymodiolus thermophilus thioautotrophic gill symbiont]|uniref:Uncharacterized protein n=1 Tax=Bathymodiolus thermophilus thioautotrophic gill symbiont TaxID=2360 RepID=A0A3G3IMW6_9GAMM|nr:hypothetical protein MS2017_1401 [Bathymodiolus thermophilus thioautotrophic gill symbiont]